MADFDAALDRQHALAVGRRVACDDVADVGHDIGLGQVAAPVDAGVVEVGLVGAADEVAHAGDRAVGHDLHRLASVPIGPEVARLAAEVVLDLGVGREAEAGLQARHLAGLDLVQVMVAAHQQQPDRGLGDVAAVVLCSSVASTSDLTVCASGSRSSAATSSQVLLPGVGVLVSGCVGAARARDQRQRFGQFDVGGVVAGRAVDERVFAGVGDDLELVRARRRRWRRCRRPPRGTAGRSGRRCACRRRTCVW